MMNDGTKLMVTAQPGVDGSGNQVTRYAYTADRYKVYATVDGINVNRSIDVASQVGQGYVPKGKLSGFTIPTGGIATSLGTTVHAGTYTGVSIPSPAVGGDAATANITVVATGDVAGTPALVGLSGGVTGGSPYTVNTFTSNGIGAGGSIAVTLSGVNAGTVAVTGGSGYAVGDTITIPAGSLGIGSSAATVVVGSLSSSTGGKISSVTITSGGSGFATGSVTIAASAISGNVLDTGTYTMPVASGNIGVGNSSVTALSVGGAITGSAPAGTYTLRSQQTNNALTGTFAGSTVANLGGVAGTYSVNVAGGTGSGGVALINYAGNGVITGIQLSGGSGYTTANALTIPAGALGSGSTALTLGSVGAGNLLTGTFLGMQDAGGSNVLSAQAVQAGSAGGVQTFTFSNGISITMSTPAGDDVGAIAGNLNSKTITIANNPTGTMGFVAGKNIDSLARDQFGVPAYTTNTTITTSVGSGTRVNNLALNIDSTNMTAYTAAEQTYTSTTNGNPLSQLTGYSFDNKGNLVASYGDGTTMIKGQLAIASFNNTEGLIPVGLNSFQVSGTTGMTSGAAVYGTANSGNFGAVQGKAVESSNVDLTGELVKLMTLQRLYTANSQAVKIEAATLVDDAIRIGQ